MTREQLSLRIGAVCVIIGSVAVVAFRTAHGDLPTGTGEDTLVYVASHPIYPLVHLGDWLGVLLWAGGLSRSQARLHTALLGQSVAWERQMCL